MWTESSAAIPDMKFNVSSRITSTTHFGKIANGSQWLHVLSLRVRCIALVQVVDYVNSYSVVPTIIVTPEGSQYCASIIVCSGL